MSSAIHGQQKLMKQQNLTYYDKTFVLDFYHNHKAYLTQVRIVGRLRESGYMTITQPTLSRLIRDEDLIRAYVSAHPERLHHKRRPLVTLPEVDAALTEWVLQKQNSNICLTGELLIEKARDFCRLLHVPSEDQLEFSSGWLTRFKQRVGLRQVVFHGEAASACLDTLADERRRFQQILPQFAPHNQFNMDETAMFIKACPDRGLATGKKSGVKSDKTRLTYALCANADGSEKRKALVIGHAKKPRCFPMDVRAIGFDYYWNKTAWMQRSIWEEYV